MSFKNLPKFFVRITFFFVFFFSINTSSQEQKNDLLEQYSYEVLDSLYANDFYQDISKSQKIAQAHLQKAQKEQNFKAQGVALLRLAVTENRQDRFENAHRYIDEAILLAKEKIKDSNIISQFLIYKGNIYYTAVDYENAILTYVKAYEFQKGNETSQLSLDITHNIANLKSTIGDEQEAKRIYIKNYDIYRDIEENNPETLAPFSYVSTLIALSDTYIDEAIDTEDFGLKNKLLDTATYYNNIGFEKSKKYDDVEGFNYFLVRKGMISYEKKNYQEALNEFNLALKGAKEIELTSTLTSIYFYLAKCNQQLSKLDTSILYYQKIDSVSNTETEPSIYLPETYLALVNLYIKKSDSDNALKYHDLFAKIDKAANEKTIEVYKKIHGKYDLNLLNSTIEKLKEDNKEQQTNYVTSVIIIIVLIAAFVVFYVLNYRSKRKNRLAFEHLLKQLEAKKKEAAIKIASKKEEKPKSKLSIDEAKVNEILKALEKFEQKKQFLDVNCNLDFVAKKVKTNKAYLSKVIHAEKQQKFIGYITNLRINHALEKLKEDKLFRSYDIKSIASELGFKSPDSFSRAFKNKTGIYPSYYIKNINKINNLEEKK
ncbi:helix-turn-helix domain-containing protein [Kordia sp.]|uniref:helix-turn-helix domain-containing protein n=1 Tax=Kordia sp. TaxID=1965332 RepID=UPI003B5BE0CA